MAFFFLYNDIQAIGLMAQINKLKANYADQHH